MTEWAGRRTLKLKNGWMVRQRAPFVWAASYFRPFRYWSPLDWWRRIEDDARSWLHYRRVNKWLERTGGGRAHVRAGVSRDEWGSRRTSVRQRDNRG